MSARQTVQIFKRLSERDVKVLSALELGIGRYEYMSASRIARMAGLSLRGTQRILDRLHKLGLIRRWKGPFVGYSLNYAGYDCLAIHDLVRSGVLEAFGNPVGLGKEADVYDALGPRGEKVIVKFHRLGRISFRQTKRKRGYLAERPEAPWLAQSKLAAEKEYQALQTVYPRGVSVPKPIAQNRHVVVMDLIRGAPLSVYSEIPEAEKVLREVLENIRRTYEAGIVHADLSEYNVLIKPDGGILIIDWPQYVTKDHPNAGALLKRDVENVLRYFERKFKVKVDPNEALRFVKGEIEVLP